MMYLKTIARRTYLQYKLILANYYKTNNYFHIPNIFPRDVVVREPKVFIPSNNTLGLGKIQTRFEYARRILVDNVLKRVTNSLASDLRKRTARHLLSGNGNPSPFFALVGISLASGNGYITRQHEFEGICWEIRKSINRLRKNLDEAETSNSDEYSLDSLEIGPVIAKGSNAVVYEAREKNSADDNISDSSNSVYPLAVKMMFNYDAESNSISILRSMYREMVPLQNIYKDANFHDIWKNEFAERIQHLPSHPNIVAMFKAFTDYVPNLPDSQDLYPEALPTRINPDGYGRNMSLFLVMKKYSTNLRNYLTSNTPRIRDGILLLCQLLEGITHMNKYEIAHRDLKSDNILLDTSEGDSYCPTLVITDFGCCLSDRNYGLSMPYKTPYIDKGGNAALMAPEVICAKPGMFSSINYSKSDAWAAGTLAYEIFTCKNPFYAQKKKSDEEILRNVTYKESMLPELPADMPSVIKRLIQSLLIRNPAKRLDAELAATICQIYLWAPSKWLVDERKPSNNEILQWLLSLTTKVLYEGAMWFDNEKLTKKRTSTTEYQLIGTFLQRIKLVVVRKALDWINNIENINFINYSY